METRFLESLINVAKEGSIAAAARKQGLTPAAIGQRIIALEQELGFPVLERVGHRSHPTEACLRLLPHAIELVKLTNQLADKVDLHGMTGTLRVGVISTLFQDLMPSILRRVYAELPSLRLQLSPGTSMSLYDAFCNDEIDAALIVAPAFEIPKTAIIEKLLDEPLVLLTPARVDGSIEDTLAANPFLRYDSTSWGGIIADRYLRDRNIKVDPLVELDSLETIAILVGEGLGVSLVPYWKGLKRFAPNVHVSAPLPREYDREICLIFPTKTRHDPLWLAFRKLVAACAAQLNASDPK